MVGTVINRLQRNLSLLTVSNPKLLKGMATGYASAGLSLAPAWESGFNTCPSHTKECSENCLFKAGRGAMQKVQAARVRRTIMFFKEREAFMQLLNSDIYQFVHNAEACQLSPVFRLNVLSDIRWEKLGVPQRWKDFRFYDYTKIPNRKGLPSNYTLTYSFSGTNLKWCLKMLGEGHNVAVPFLKELPAMWQGYKVIDGDADDLRMLDEKPCIVGLRAKGPLRRDPTSAFLGDNHAS